MNIRPTILKILTLVFAVYSIIFLTIVILQYKLRNDYKGRCSRICGDAEVVSCEEPFLICYEVIGDKEQYWIFDFDLVSNVD